jgi:hypothetical protein
MDPIPGHTELGVPEARSEAFDRATEERSGILEAGILGVGVGVVEDV